jgi:hypothetical protein
MIWWMIVSFLLGLAWGMSLGWIVYVQLWRKHEQLRQRMRAL